MVEVIGVLFICELLGREDFDINNFFIIILKKFNVDFKKVFKGGIDGEVIIMGIVLEFVVGGNVEVFKGKIFLN